jgi:hypothetical protein
MRPLFCLAAVLLLCSCSSPPQVNAYVAGAPYASGPTSADDPRMHHPQFFMDDSDQLPAWTRSAPSSNR